MPSPFVLCRTSLRLITRSLGPLVPLGLVGLLAAASMAPAVVAQPAAGADSLPGLVTVPKGAVLIKGAEPSASDAQTPVPEGGRVGPGLYDNDYFKLRFTFPAAWTEKYAGPPPSDSGYYVLAQLQPADSAANGRITGPRGTVQITARDLLFTDAPQASAQALLAGTQAELQPVYQLDQPVARVQMAGRSFVRLAYSSAQAGLRWSVWATEIRCHVVQFVITSPDPAFIDTALKSVRKLQLPAQAGIDPGTDSGPETGTGGAQMPMCIAGYASPEHLLRRVDPILPPGRFNPIPVRIIIDNSGEVRHIHILSAFPEQAQAVNAALRQWRFKPHVIAGHPVEVETGLLFGLGRHVRESGN